MMIHGALEAKKEIQQQQTESSTRHLNCIQLPVEKFRHSSFSVLYMAITYVLVHTCAAVNYEQPTGRHTVSDS